MRPSIHILTRDRFDALAVLLSSLFNQTTKEFDIVIMDNGINPITQVFTIQTLLNRLQYEGVRVNVIQNKEEHRDIGRYRNQIIENDTFKNPIGIRIDDDSMLEPNYIEIIMNGFTDDKIAVVGGICPYVMYPKTYSLMPNKFNYVPPEILPWADNCVTFFRCIDKNGKDKHWRDTYFESGHIRSNYAYRMDVAKKIKFPEWTGPSGYTEETQFCVKVWMNGYKILFNPNAIAWHFAYPSGGGRDKILSQAQMEETKERNHQRLTEELNFYRMSLGIEKRGYP